ncbi:type 1 glutamine amidotransferase domain-containing protein [Labrenzia sp. 011]|uniref:type 1 glutamine amidotransferase domain-containing protein n=1 Tax=Labrenzia sp. 011 TaxID=2171494 RepID=UPI000D5186AC|nr:type 1 glutamine amidotransferase domain-containing protein [Labrenzia sp. 011]PVB63400.1 protease [Labrenzia sp. 011]
MPKITEAKILIMATHGFEQSELEVPLNGLREKGATVDVATLDGKAIKGWKDNDWGDEFSADLKIADVKVDDYIALVLPGGQMNPDILRTDKETVAKVREFVSADKIVAAICHAPWLLIEAGVVKGREMTSYHSIRTDLKNAGANVVDKEVAISNGIITSRSPEDLEAFVAKIVEEVKEGEHQRKVA